MNTPEHDIQKKVLDRIRAGGVQMRPRIYFWARVVFTAAVALCTLLVSTFVLSFIIFSIHESGEQFLLGFGSRGISTFLALFPWVSLAVDILLVLVLELLLQSFKLGYRFSLLSLFVIAFATSALLAASVDLTPLHTVLLNRADNDTLPVVGKMYEGIRGSHEQQGVFRGTIVSMHSGEIVITHDDGDHDADDGTWTVSLPAGASAFKVGDRVYVLGSLQGKVVQAYGIEPLASDQ